MTHISLGVGMIAAGNLGRGNVTNDGGGSGSPSWYITSYISTDRPDPGEEEVLPDTRRGPGLGVLIHHHDIQIY